jgi:hypothetical protein
MKKLRRYVLALLTIALILPPAIAAADQPSPKALVVPIAGAGHGGVSFTGTVTVRRFVQRNGAVFAVGAISGTVYGPAGPIGTSLVLPVSFPVRVGVDDSLAARAEPGRIHLASFSAPDGGARLILAQASTCGVLHLDLGAVNLNLLGVAVTTTPVTIDINGKTSGPLGNLVCAALATVNNVVGLVNVLNSLLSLVTGLVGGVTGGLGGAAM